MRARARMRATVRARAGYLDIDANVLAELFERLAQVHREVLKSHALVILVLEISEQANTVLLILGVILRQLLQQLDLP